MLISFCCAPVIFFIGLYKQHILLCNASYFMYCDFWLPFNIPSSFKCLRAFQLLLNNNQSINRNLFITPLRSLLRGAPSRDLASDSHICVTWCALEIFIVVIIMKTFSMVSNGLERI